SPVGSMRPAAISRKSLFPITHAAIPNGRQTNSPMIPNARISPPRWGASARRGDAFSTRSSPQYRQRVAAALIVSPHIGQAIVASSRAAGPGAGIAAGREVAADDSDSDDSPPGAGSLAAGTSTGWPQPGQLALTPALSSGVFRNLSQCGQ